MNLGEFLAEWKSNSPEVLVHTSGSTGKPKPMWVSKQRMLNSARITCDFLGLKAGDSALLCMKLDYIAGKMVVVRAMERGLNLLEVVPSGHPLASLLQGNYRIWQPLSASDNLDTQKGQSTLSFSKERSVLKPFPSDISLPDVSHKTTPLVPDFAAMVPLQVYNSLQVSEEANLLRNIQHLIIGGGSIDLALENQLRHFPHAVWSTYGMTETLSHIALRRLNGPTASEWYTPFESVKVSRNADGCLVIDAPLVHESELVTNDRVEFRPLADKGKGGRLQFRILGRKDNVIDSGGIKIQIEEVEKILRPVLHSPYLITKRPDEKFGEIVVLLTEQTDLDSVKVRCERVLPRYWQPRLYLHVDRLPYTETGKPARAEAERIALQQ
ncbi:O-succinylbenzoic acid--CoA ligase [Prevotella cerevisiae]|uniref:O-succinylbenzoic acid--CoA ligase n=1 Tax=Segatella cerevisiae TaxID=2053716 RepID=A0ABT1BVK7_9BACT|nr:O-succinylbenzoic acid--CoA ligase [Segatella cerevisiae]MCO6024433.1 O-succinylbenzoic acid--CoA ligase [Segatella cerevisiae]